MTQICFSPPSFLFVFLDPNARPQDSFKDRPGIYVLLKRAAVVPTARGPGAKRVAPTASHDIQESLHSTQEYLLGVVEKGSLMINVCSI